MKRATQKMMVGTMVLACLTLGAGGLHAQVTQVVTIKASASVQGAYSTSYNAHTGITTYAYAAPIKHSVATKDLLAILATDNQTTFPSGAKLVISHVTPPDGVVTLVPDGNSPVNNNVNNMDEDFQVVDKNNNLLIDVSDIMSINIAGGNNITSGKSTSSNPGLGTSSNEQLLSISFDDTGVGGSLKFFLTGVRTDKTTDTTPNKTTGAYTESSSSSLSSGTGEGSYHGNPLVCTGTVSTSGKATLNINHP